MIILFRYLKQSHRHNNNITATSPLLSLGTPGHDILRILRRYDDGILFE